MNVLTAKEQERIKDGPVKLKSPARKLLTGALAAALVTGSMLGPQAASADSGKVNAGIILNGISDIAGGRDLLGTAISAFGTKALAGKTDSGLDAVAAKEGIDRSVNTIFRTNNQGKYGGAQQGGAVQVSNVPSQHHYSVPTSQVPEEIGYTKTSDVSSTCAVLIKEYDLRTGNEWASNCFGTTAEGQARLAALDRATPKRLVNLDRERY